MAPAGSDTENDQGSWRESNRASIHRESPMFNTEVAAAGSSLLIPGIRIKYARRLRTWRFVIFLTSLSVLTAWAKGGLEMAQPNQIQKSDEFKVAIAAKIASVIIASVASGVIYWG